MYEDVFISYSRKDSTAVKALRQNLHDAGVSIWMDEGGIDGALLWGQEIVEAIERCKVMILMVSDASINSHNVVKETALASEIKKPILPLHLEHVELPNALRYQLAGIQHIAMHKGNPTDNFRAVLRSLERLGVQTNGAFPDEVPPLPVSEKAYPQSLPAATTTPDSQKLLPARIAAFMIAMIYWLICMTGDVVETADMTLEDTMILLFWALGVGMAAFLSTKLKRSVWLWSLLTLVTMTAALFILSFLPASQAHDKRHTQP